MAQVLSRIAAAAQAWQQPGGKAKTAGNPQAATATTPQSAATPRTLTPEERLHRDRELALGRADPYPPDGPNHPMGSREWYEARGYDTTPFRRWDGLPPRSGQLDEGQWQDYFAAPQQQGQREFWNARKIDVNDTAARTRYYYDNIDPHRAKSLGGDGAYGEGFGGLFGPKDVVDDNRDRVAAADVLQTAARRNKSRRKDPQVAIAKDEAGRSRRRRTLAALGTRKSPAGSGVLGGGGQPGQAVRPGRTSAASVLG